MINGPPKVDAKILQYLPSSALWVKSLVSDKVMVIISLTKRPFAKKISWIKSIATKTVLNRKETMRLPKNLKDLIKKHKIQNFFEIGPELVPPAHLKAQ